MRAGLDQLARNLVSAWGCWAPTLTADGRRLAYVSDRNGVTGLWVRDVEPSGHHGVAHEIPLGPDPVVSAHWSPDGRWLACAVAAGGGVRTEVWVVRPDGSAAVRVAEAHAALGPWARHGHRLVVTAYRDATNRCLLVDAETGAAEELVAGPLLQVMDLSEDDRFVLLREGPRGGQRCLLLDRTSGHTEELLPFPTVGSTDLGVLRKVPPTAGGPALVAHLVTDAGLPRRSLVAVPIGADGRRGPVGAVARRREAELELVDADRDGRLLLLSWNVDGRSDVSLFDVASQSYRAVDPLPGTVVNSGVLSRDGSRAVLSVERFDRPRQLWELRTDTGRWTALTDPTLQASELVQPTPEQFESHDGLAVRGWLYRARPPGDQSSGDQSPGDHQPGDRPPAAVVYVHGGPEAQERPDFNPQHQLLAAAGLTVFAPNIRGSSGYGRTFVHADDRFGRLDAIGDVAAAGRHLVERGLAAPDRLAVAGRSYGGYAVLMALATYPDLFAAGVDVCGMSDLRTFYRDTEPWIAEAAVTKYGDPERDAWLLTRLSPMRLLDRIRAPLLVAHGSLDTNVPVGEAHQVVAALQRLGRSVQYLELAGEGHEYRRTDSRLRLLRSILDFLDRRLSDPVAASVAK